jgi:hypothetical protein
MYYQYKFHYFIKIRSVVIMEFLMKIFKAKR